MAKALQDELMALSSSSSPVKGKGREDRDLPPHMATIAGLQSNGQDVLDDDTYGLYSYPTTCSQAKDGRKSNYNE
jgi:hypothetical protein